MTEYNIGNIRKLLEAALTSNQFENLVFDHFNKAREELTNESLSARIRELICYAEKQRKIEVLLEEVKQINPAVYQEFEDKFGAFSLLIDELAEIIPKAVKRKIPPLLAYLPNRHEQEDELKQAYQKLLNQGLPRPLVCIIHGDEYQTQDKFFERLHEYFIPQLLGLDRNQTSIKTYTLPYENMAQLERWLCDKLADLVLGSKYFSLEAINDFFCKYPSPIIVRTQLLTQDWQGNREVLRKLLGFWQRWPDLVTGQHLIICLFFKYEEGGRNSKKSSFPWLWGYLEEICYRRVNAKIYKQIEALSTSNFKQFDRIHSVVLPKLTDIRKKHVYDWAESKDTIQFVGEDMTQELNSAIRDMFDSWRGETGSHTIPMECLGKKLTNLLERLSDQRGVV